MPGLPFGWATYFLLLWIAFAVGWLVGLYFYPPTFQSARVGRRDGKVAQHGAVHRAQSARSFKAWRDCHKAIHTDICKRP
jgi:hypothetical protein